MRMMGREKEEIIWLEYVILITSVLSTVGSVRNEKRGEKAFPICVGKKKRKIAALE